MLERAAQHPGWIVVSHENQCLDPLAAFRALMRTLGLEWTAAVERAVLASNRFAAAAWSSSPAVV